MSTCTATPADTSTAPPAPDVRPRQWPHRALMTALLTVGVCVPAYPVAATFANDYNAHQFAQQNVVAVEHHDDATRAKKLAAARTYNEALAGRMMAAKNNTAYASTPITYAAYSQQLETPTMAMLTVPKLHLTLPISHGTSDAALESGAGHMYGTSLPVGGESTRAVIAGHSGMANMTAFNTVKDLVPGDKFFIQVEGETLAYQVDPIPEPVLPNDLSGIRIEPGKDLVTLLTCTPVPVNDHRLLVTGHRVPYDAADLPTMIDRGFTVTVQSWMWPFIAVSVLSLLFLVWSWLQWLRADHQARQARKMSALETTVSPDKNHTQEV